MTAARRLVSLRGDTARTPPIEADDLDNIILMALQKEPSRRYGSAAELSEDLRRYQTGEPIRARPVRTLERTGRRQMTWSFLELGQKISTGSAQGISRCEKRPRSCCAIVPSPYRATPGRSASAILMGLGIRPSLWKVSAICCWAVTASWSCCLRCSPPA